MWANTGGTGDRSCRSDGSRLIMRPADGPAPGNQVKPRMGAPKPGDSASSADEEAGLAVSPDRARDLRMAQPTRMPPRAGSSRRASTVVCPHGSSSGDLGLVSQSTTGSSRPGHIRSGQGCWSGTRISLGSGG